MLPGRYFEEFQVGQVIRHGPRRTITQKDNVAFSKLTDDIQPLHIDEAYARRSRFGRLVVNGLYPLAWAVGVSGRDTTDGTLVATLGYDEARSTAPLFPGDTIRCETQVLECRDADEPDRGMVTLRHTVYNQNSVAVASLQRVAVVERRSPEPPG